MVNNFIISLVSIFVFVYVCQLFFEMKVDYSRVLILCFLSIIGKASLISYFNFQMNLIYSLVLFAILIYALFEGLAFYKAIFICIYIFVSAVSEMFTLKILSLLFQKTALLDNLVYWLGIIISNILLISIFYLASKIRLFDKNELPKYSWIMIILPITSVLLVLGIEDYYFLIDNNSLIFVVIGLFLSNCISIFIFYRTVKEITDKNKLAKELEETSTKNGYLNKLLQQHNVFLHSIRKQSQDMIAYLNRKEYDELSEYIKNVYSDTTNVYNMINSDYEIVDMIINDRLYIIKNNNITLRVKIEDTDFFPLDYVHTESMFNLLIDLGINECIKTKEETRILVIKSKRIGEQNILTVSYSSNQSRENNPLFDALISLIEQYHLEYMVEHVPERNQTNITVLFVEG